MTKRLFYAIILKNTEFKGEIALEDIYYALNPWWEGKDFESGIPRQVYLDKLSKNIERKQIEIIAGSRRIGKTTVLRQIARHVLEKKIPAKNILFLSLDHPRLSGVPLTEHLNYFRRIFKLRREEKVYLFLDEVQESANWEAELKAIYDNENVKIICSGSTPSLIRNQGGRLTGRQITTVLYPLDLKEFLSFRKETPSQSENYRYENLAEDYLSTGGYPENVLNPSDEYLNNLLQDILAKDLAGSFHPKKQNIFRDLMRLLAAGVSSRTSFNRLSNILGISLDTVKEYIAYLESSFLIKSVEKWSASYTDRIYSTKKIYFIDTGLQSLFTGRSSLGAKAENAVLMHFLRKGEQCGYFAESEREIDFAHGAYENPAGTEVKYVSEFNWKDKKFSGVRLFLARFPAAKEITIVTKSAEDEMKASSARITVIPLWKFLLRF
ncbi:hypothetical protein COY52_07490 [Candidatus Desantisbacteria bacterium CG_4_10_14_0_8_um_filter_48_22]|uniref:AAA+ ATPase domain-containing protein n=1 Tax=Candidatus Desantisbacteria bacterium CG_4_10_14_0_8_um_filter_48_22 TaxID=1974543 RepID=A0A2M7SA05_9BACT|nr:MAG: hypothetical protein COY52_07490 [Candidatus Desantisbacteria bacterium CG_4_10_14_0_8_um_filter_48_22]